MDIMKRINLCNADCDTASAAGRSIKKDYRLFLAGLVFGIPGLIISIKGIGAAVSLAATGKLWWTYLAAAGVLAGFLAMFTKIVRKYSERILELPDKNVFKTFSIKGYVLIIFMMCLGMVLKRIPGIPTEFYASFYPGLGIALIVAAVEFFTFSPRTGHDDH